MVLPAMTRTARASAEVTRPYDRLRVAEPDRRPLRLPPPTPVGPVEVDLLRLTARLGDEAYAMNAQSLRLLCLLAANASRVLTRREVWSALGGLRPPPPSNAVDAMVKDLRRLGGPAGHGLLVETVRGRGYRLASGAK